jgi:hypothetical protein
MFNNQTAPMQNNSTQVHQTKDYSKFKTLVGNRNLNPLHLSRLKDSMKKKYLFTIITVNERLEIIDGQHRFNACCELGLPVNYVIASGYGLNEVQVLNENSKTWNASDYLNGYCNLGYPEYLKYKRFLEKFELPHKVNLCLLEGIRGDGGNSTERFKNGTFTVKEEAFSYECAKKIKQVKSVYAGAERFAFALALVSCLRKPLFSFEEFMDRMKYKSSILVDCTTISSYMALIEEIYNFRRREKVNLRF